MKIRVMGQNMNEYIACCGLNCEKCDAYIAAETNDEELRKKTAKLWSELNGVNITPDMINCSGCRRDGVKTPYCGYVCAIRKCAKEINLKLVVLAINLSHAKFLDRLQLTIAKLKKI